MNNVASLREDRVDLPSMLTHFHRNVDIRFLRKIQTSSLPNRHNVRLVSRPKIIEVLIAPKLIASPATPNPIHVTEPCPGHSGSFIWVTPDHRVDHLQLRVKVKVFVADWRSSQKKNVPCFSSQLMCSQ